jgi:hypothetical protein
LEYFNWELFDHRPYTPDLAPSDYRLFTLTQYINNNEELMEGVKTWLIPQAADFLDISIQNLFPDTSAPIRALTTLKSS